MNICPFFFLSIFRHFGGGGATAPPPPYTNHCSEPTQYRLLHYQTGDFDPDPETGKIKLSKMSVMLRISFLSFLIVLQLVFWYYYPNINTRIQFIVFRIFWKVLNLSKAAPVDSPFCDTTCYFHSIQVLDTQNKLLSKFHVWLVWFT